MSWRQVRTSWGSAVEKEEIRNVRIQNVYDKLEEQFVFHGIPRQIRPRCLETRPTTGIPRCTAEMSGLYSILAEMQI